MAIRALAIWFGAIAGLIALPATAQEDSSDLTREPKHIALIIGNTDYSPAVSNSALVGRLPRLPNACGDSQTVAAGLVQIGWDEADITQKCDQTTAQMLAEIRAFVQEVQDNPYSIAVFYFAGHGVQIDKKSFIFGIEAKPNFVGARRLIAQNSDAQLFYGSALEIYSDFVNAVGAITDGGFTVIIDACRSDPLIQALGGGPRNVTAPLAKSRLLPGVLLAVSTQDGDTAADNSAYAMALKALIRRQADIATILTRVANKVYNDTKLTAHPQIPTMSGGLVVPCFAGCVLGQTDIPPQPPARSSRIDIPAAFPIERLRLLPASFQPLQDIPQVPAVVPRTNAKKIQNEALYTDPALSGPTQVRGSRIDVFWCEGGANASVREGMARHYGELLAALARDSKGAFVSVRLRSLSPNANGLPIYRFLRNSIVVDPTDPIESQVAQTKLRTGSIQFERLISHTTPNYVSLFICEADPRTAPAQVYWQAPGEPERALAIQLLQSFREDVGQFHSLRRVEIVPVPPTSTEVRYYYPDDRDVAYRLADSLQAALRHEVKVKLFESISGRVLPGKLEVWIGTDELSRPASAAVEPGSIGMPSRNSVLTGKVLRAPQP